MLVYVALQLRPLSGAPPLLFFSLNIVVYLVSVASL